MPNASAPSSSEVVAESLVQAAAKLVDDLYADDRDAAGRAVESILEDVDWSKVPPDRIKRIVGEIGEHLDPESVTFERTMRDDDLAETQLYDLMYGARDALGDEFAAALVARRREQHAAKTGSLARVLQHVKRAMKALNDAVDHPDISCTEVFLKIIGETSIDTMRPAEMGAVLAAILVSTDLELLDQLVAKDIEEAEQMLQETDSEHVEFDDAKKFGDRLREHRKAKDVNLGDMADRLGIKPSLLSDVELGRRAPFVVEDIEKCVNILGLTRDEHIKLIELANDTAPSEPKHDGGFHCTAEDMGLGRTDEDGMPEPALVAAKRHVLRELVSRALEIKDGLPLDRMLDEGTFESSHWTEADMRHVMREFICRCPAVLLDDVVKVGLDTLKGSEELLADVDREEAEAREKKLAELHARKEKLAQEAVDAEADLQALIAKQRRDEFIALCESLDDVGRAELLEEAKRRLASSKQEAA